jgi:hypothetical protein
MALLRFLLSKFHVICPLFYLLLTPKIIAINRHNVNILAYSEIYISLHCLLEEFHFLLAAIPALTFLLEEKLQKKSRPVLVAGAKTSLFAKIYTSRLRLLTGTTFENFFTLITCLLPTHYAMGGGGKIRNTKNPAGAGFFEVYVKTISLQVSCI